MTVEKFFLAHAEGLGLEPLAGSSGMNRLIREPTVNRPGLVLSGFTKHFASKRIQVLGSAETAYLHDLPASEREHRYARLMEYRIPCFVFSRGLEPDEVFLRAAELAQIPVFKTPLITMRFINQATMALEMMFAPRGTDMGSMVDILGTGVIVRGESGIGKSECVLALIERGYSLVSDDVTKVTLVDGREVVGSSAETTRNFMEVRGIGIINVASMFGVRSVRHEKRVDLVVTLKVWDEVKDVERLGLEQQHTRILGVPIPHIVIPVRPGRDLARLVEVAAFQTKLREAGLNAPKDLDDRLIRIMRGPGAD
ncbi:MAG: HPr kinase/phosphorylase [Verrucomicrobiota bacterium]